MIGTVVLKNYLSYADGTIPFTGSITAVVGENGAGKSGLLEAIPYAYFGIGRDSLSNLSRINGDGSHEVQVWETPTLCIKRGRKENGKGYLEVREGEELIAKGNEAQAWITEHLGMDVDTYMLTVFYGLHDSWNDRLIRVLPSVRLEAMQKLAKIGPYAHFEAGAKKGLDEATLKYEKAVSRKEGADSVITDDGLVKEGIAEGTKRLSELADMLKNARERRKSLQESEQAYQAFVRERERLSVERDQLRKDIAGYESEIDDAKQDISIALEQSKVSIESKKETEKILPDKSLSELKELAETTVAAISGLQSMLGLKSAATLMGSVTPTCPLCGSEIAAELFEQWNEDVLKLTDDIAESTRSLEACRKDVLKKEQAIKRLETISRTLEECQKIAEEGNDRVVKLTRELGQLRGELAKKDSRYVDLTEKLGDEYQTLQGDIKANSEDIELITEETGSINGSLHELSESLKRNERSRKTSAESEKEMADARTEIEAYRILRAAWNRYGIPLRLMETMSRDIETRATEVYQEFDSGSIEVREVEDRGRPGIEFYLIDRKGERTFAQLSAGEKVMFFVAIRVAIARIVSESGSVGIDYLIFDEAMGNLSAKRRDDLIRIVNKVLRKSFPQVIMVSHTEMRDIFTQTIRVVSVNETSSVSVA